MKLPSSLFHVWMTTMMMMMMTSDFGSVYGFLSGHRIDIHSKLGQYHPSAPGNLLLLRISDAGNIISSRSLSNDDDNNNNNANESSSDDNSHKETHTMEHDFDQEIHKRSQQWKQQQQQKSPENSDDNVIMDGGHDSSPIIPMPADTRTVSSSSSSSMKRELEFRQQERELLGELLDGDDAVAKLRQLWFGEGGPKMEAQLVVANACIGKGPSLVAHDGDEDSSNDDDDEDGGGSIDNWTKAERILLELIEQDATFLEPFVRLSKLYTLQGRFADSQQICLAIHAKRPWHYVALETMVVNTMVLEHNQDLKTWASKRLPKPSLTEQRTAWVKQAIADSIRLEEESVIMEQKRQADANDQEVAGKDDNDWQ